MRTVLKISALALAGSVAASAASAGGFSRGSANTDILLDDGHSFMSGVTYVDPTRKNENGIDTAASYAVFSAAAGLRYNDLKCAATFAQPFGLDSDESQTTLAPGNAISDTASSTELGATCGYRFDVGGVQAHVLGGIFYQTLEYEREYFAGPVTPVLNLKDSAIGYRLGVAVTKPEIALKASLMYRSEVDHDLAGSLSSSTVLSPFFTTGASTATITTPQSAKFSFQSGIAPGWLAFGSVEWTDWSILQVTPVFVDGIAAASLNSGFRDGWTITGGIGHKVTEKLSVAASVTWDRGVSDGFAAAGGQKISPSFGSVTFGAGGSYAVNEKVTVRGGVGYTHLNGGTFFDLDDSVSKTYPSGYAIAGSFSLNMKF